MNFHETPQGRKFFNQDVPAVIRALNSIVGELRRVRTMPRAPITPEELLIDFGVTSTRQLNDCPNCGSLLDCDCSGVGAGTDGLTPETHDDGDQQ